MLPNFLICGIQKGGTTSLYNYLRQHPEVYMPHTKEINYFNLNYEKGQDWYESHFELDADRRAIGEASPLYMWYPEVAERLAQLLPEAKLIFVLRNPIERAYSNYWFNVSRGAQDPSNIFSDIIRTQKGHWMYLSKGLYFEQIMRLRQYFEHEQLHILITERLRANPEQVLASCYEFLDISTGFQPNMAQHHNVTVLPRGMWANAIYRNWIQIKNILKPNLPVTLKNRAQALRSASHGLLFTPKQAPPIPEADRIYLRTIFKSQNEALAEFLKADLSCWDI